MAADQPKVRAERRSAFDSGETARARAQGRPLPLARKPARQTSRFLLAYLTTLRVLWSYLWIFFWARFFGEAWKAPRLLAAHEANASRVMRTIIELQGLFIKVGQLLSVLANFLPAPFREGLASLQDAVPPREGDKVRSRIETELGKPVSDIFERFDDSPIASASLGQVHEAYLPDGRHVAVKVQHGDIDEIVKLDLKTIRRIMTLVSRFLPAKNLDVYYRQIKAMIEEELDFEREARNVTRIAQNFDPQGRVRFPLPIPELSTRRVLVSTFVTGIKVSDLEGINKQGIDRKDLARRIVETFCQMIFKDGVYHADPHPGNMLVGEDGGLILLDFGAVAELSQDMKEGIPELLEGVIRRDTDRLIRALRRMGFIAKDTGEEVSERVVEFFHQRFQEDVKLESFNLKDIRIDPERGLQNLMSLRRMNIGLRELSEAFHVPKDWVYLERTLLLLTGVCTELDPEMNPVETIYPYVQSFVLGNRDWAQIALEAAKDMGLKAITLPDHLRKFLLRANRGEAEVRVRDLQRAANTVARGLRQLGTVVLALGVGALALHAKALGLAGWSQSLLIAAGVLGSMAVLSMLISAAGDRS